MVIALSFFNIFILISFNNIKQEKTISEDIYYNKQNVNIDKLNLYKASFISNILNSDLQLSNVKIKNSINHFTPLKEAFEEEQEQLLVYRFSKMHCESCIVSSIEILQKWCDSIGKINILFLGNYSNNRIFQRTIPNYSIGNMKVYNTPAFNIPAEEKGYPYFFTLNRDLHISNVFFPNKAIPKITDKYLETIQKKFNLM